MTRNEVREIFRNGLWSQNTGLVQLLGLCPLLAVSSTVVNSVSLGLATAMVMTLTGLTVSLIRNLVPAEIRLPVYILIIAALVTVVDLVMHAWFLGLYKVLGIFVPLIVVNCIVLGRAESFASRNEPVPAMLDGLAMGIGLTLVLAAVGAIRELAGKGTLLSGIHLVLGEGARGAVITALPDYPGFLVAILPPGAFLALGLLIALKNRIDQRSAPASAPAPAAQPAIAA